MPPHLPVYVHKKNLIALCSVLLMFFCFGVRAHNVSPPLPLPSEAQIKRGHELIKAIQKTIKHAPMSDSSAVIAALGLKTSAEFAPNNFKGFVLKSHDLKQSGYLYVGHSPEVLGFASREQARLNLNIETNVACISYEMVKAAFGESYRSTEEPHVRFGNAPTPPPVIPHFGISYITTVR
jgi:hypothetical protein